MGIEIKNLNKSFGDNHVLKGIDFLIEPGKINMIIGASGSGKSVMLKCIVGLIRPDEGEVLYDNINFHELHRKDKKQIRQEIGMLFQGSALFDSMTAEENIAFPLKMFTRMKSHEIRERVDFCLERVNLPGVNKLYPAELSGGMQKRVGIARSISMNPKYLFVDEPNSGLDPPTASVIDQLIVELTHEFGMTTMIVSHDLNSMFTIGEKIMFLHKGKKEWEGTKHGIFGAQNEALQNFIFVSDLIRKGG